MISSQEVEEGVDAAVDTGQRAGDLVGEVDHVEHGAVGVQHPVGVVEGARDVEGYEAKSENHQHHHDQLDGLPAGGGRPLLAGGQAAPGPAQRPRHQAVAHHDDRKGDAEEKHHDRRAVRHVPLEVLRASGVVAHRVPVTLGDGHEGQVGRQARRDRRPRQAARHVGVPGLHLGDGADRVADAEVAVDANAGEEEDAAVQIGVEEEADDLAESHAEGPVASVAVVVDEGGQGEHVEHVRQSQVEHVHGAGVPGPHLGQEYPQGHGVEEKPAHAHQAVGHRQQDVLELLVKATGLVGRFGGFW